MGCNIPRPWKRPITPIYKPPEMPKTAPAKMHDQPYGSRTNAALNDGSNDLEIIPMNRAIIDAFDQFHQTAHDLTFHDPDHDKPIKRPLNCPNCCAPIAGPYCEYCGTVFEDVRRFCDNVVIPIYIGQTRIDDIVRRNGGSGS